MTEEINKKLFSSNSIRIATFIGGPLAFGYMMRRNCITLGQNQKGKIILILSIIFTVLLILSLLLLPEAFLVKVPNYLIPLLYTGIAFIIIEKVHGNILENHKNNGNEFFSGWNVFGTTIISMILILIIVLPLFFIFPQNEIYDIEMSKFSKNEKETLIFYDNLTIKSQSSLLQELETIIPKWKENINIINKVNQLEDLSKELKEQNKLLLEYSELRVKTFELFKKTIEEDTDKYSNELDELHLKIDKILEKLN